METVFEVLNSVGGILPDWLALFLGVMVIAKVVVALTPTPADDEWYAKVYKFVEMLALNVGRAKDPAPKSS